MPFAGVRQQDAACENERTDGHQLDRSVFVDMQDGDQEVKQGQVEKIDRKGRTCKVADQRHEAQRNWPVSPSRADRHDHHSESRAQQQVFGNARNVAGKDARKAEVEVPFLQTPAHGLSQRPQRVSEDKHGQKCKAAQHEQAARKPPWRNPGLAEAKRQRAEQPDREGRQDARTRSQAGQRHHGHAGPTPQQHPPTEDHVVPELETQRPERHVGQRHHGQIPVLLKKQRVDQQPQQRVVMRRTRIQLGRRRAPPAVEHPGQCQRRQHDRVEPAQPCSRVLLKAVFAAV